MTEKVYPVSETIRFSDGSEKVITFNLPEEKIEEDEIDAQLAEVPKAPVDENGQPFDPFNKEAGEAPAESIEETA